MHCSHQRFLYGAKHFHYERDLIGTVQLWLHHIHTARPRISAVVFLLQVRDSGHHGHHCVQQALWDVRTIDGCDCICVHVHTNVSDEQQGAPWQRDSRGAVPMCRYKCEVRIEGTGDRPPVFSESFLQVAPHEAGPVRVNLRISSHGVMPNVAPKCSTAAGLTDGMLRTRALSAPSTAATESSQSMIVVTADSRTQSFMAAG